jgi:hypothetical protein
MLLITLLVITTVLLALSGLAIMRLTKGLKDAATTRRNLKKNSYDVQQMYFEEVQAHEVALEEIADLNQRAAADNLQLQELNESNNAQSETLRAARKKLSKLTFQVWVSEAKLRQSQDNAPHNKALATAESNVRWMSDYIERLQKGLRRARLERDIARSELKYLEVTDGSLYTLRAYKSENYSKIYVVGHGYLMRPLTDGFPHLDRKGDFHPVEELVEELRTQIKAVRSVAFRGL